MADELKRRGTGPYNLRLDELWREGWGQKSQSMIIKKQTAPINIHVPITYRDRFAVGSYVSNGRLNSKSCCLHSNDPVKSHAQLEFSKDLPNKTETPYGSNLRQESLASQSDKVGVFTLKDEHLQTVYKQLPDDRKRYFAALLFQSASWRLSDAKKVEMTLKGLSFDYDNSSSKMELSKDKFHSDDDTTDDMFLMRMFQFLDDNKLIVQPLTTPSHDGGGEGPKSLTCDRYKSKSKTNMKHFKPSPIVRAFAEPFYCSLKLSDDSITSDNVKIIIKKAIFGVVKFISNKVEESSYYVAISNDLILTCSAKEMNDSFKLPHGGPLIIGLTILLLARWHGVTVVMETFGNKMYRMSSTLQNLNDLNTKSAKDIARDVVRELKKKGTESCVFFILNLTKVLYDHGYLQSTPSLSISSGMNISGITESGSSALIVVNPVVISDSWTNIRTVDTQTVFTRGMKKALDAKFSVDVNNKSDGNSDNNNTDDDDDDGDDDDHSDPKDHSKSDCDSFNSIRSNDFGSDDDSAYDGEEQLQNDEVNKSSRLKHAFRMLRTFYTPGGYVLPLGTCATYLPEREKQIKRRDGDDNSTIAYQCYNVNFRGLHSGLRKKVVKSPNAAYNGTLAVGNRKNKIINLKMMQEYNNKFINEYREIIKSFATNNCSRCESTVLIPSVDDIDSTMEKAIENLINIAKNHVTAYDASILADLMSIVLDAFVGLGELYMDMLQESNTTTRLFNEACETMYELHSNGKSFAYGNWRWKDQFQFANCLSVVLGRIMLNPFNHNVQSRLVFNVGGEETFLEYLSRFGLKDIHITCNKMLFESKEGWAIENPLLLLTHHRSRKFINKLDFCFQEVKACTGCFEYGRVGEFENNHHCKIPMADYVYLNHPTFQAYVTIQRQNLTEPQQAVSLFFPLSKTKSKSWEDNYYGKNVMLYGPPGTGKTHMHMLAVFAYLEVFGWDSLIVVAMIGDLASKLYLGETMQSVLGIGEITDEETGIYIAPLKPFELYSKHHFEMIEYFLQEKRKPMSKAASNKLNYAKGLWLDEMQLSESEFIFFDMVCRCRRGVHDRPFGGLVLHFSGDFLQATGRFRKQNLGNSHWHLLFFSQMFREEFRTVWFPADLNKRQEKEPEFRDAICDMRVGELDNKIVDFLKTAGTNIPEQIQNEIRNLMLHANYDIINTSKQYSIYYIKGTTNEKVVNSRMDKCYQQAKKNGIHYKLPFESFKNVTIICTEQRQHEMYQHLYQCSIRNFPQCEKFESETKINFFDVNHKFVESYLCSEQKLNNLKRLQFFNDVEKQLPHETLYVCRGLDYSICVNSKADKLYRNNIVRVLEINSKTQEVKIEDSRKQEKILKKTPKSKSLSFVDRVRDQLFIKRRNDVASCELVREQVNLMYNLVVTVISLQGSTLKNTFGVIDNTRNIQAGELMTALARFESVKNVMILHPITTLDELKRDCTVNLDAVKYDKFMREMFDEKCRLAEQCDKKMNPQLDILKYILKTNEYKFA